MFRMLLAHPQEVLHKQHLVYRHNTHAIYQCHLCSISWRWENNAQNMQSPFILNWIKSASCFHYTDILWCPVNKTQYFNVTGIHFAWDFQSTLTNFSDIPYYVCRYTMMLSKHKQQYVSTTLQLHSNKTMIMFQHITFKSSLLLLFSGTFLSATKILKMEAVRCYWTYTIQILTLLVHRLQNLREGTFQDSAQQHLQISTAVYTA
jgi:hypothetical protein